MNSETERSGYQIRRKTITILLILITFFTSIRDLIDYGIIHAAKFLKIIGSNFFQCILNNYFKETNMEAEDLRQFRFEVIFMHIQQTLFRILTALIILFAINQPLQAHDLLLKL